MNKIKLVTTTKKIGMILWCLLLTIAILPLHPASSEAASSMELDGLKALNEVRAKVGAPPLQLNDQLSKAARNHAEYYNQHQRKMEKDKRNELAHEEEEGQAGFTGELPSDRANYAGWNPDVQHGTSEVMSFGHTVSPTAVTSWLNTAYHREIILDPMAQYVGIGLVDGTAVFDLGLTFTNGEYDTVAKNSDALYVYPYDGMKDVPVYFDGREYPNPLDQFDVPYSGYIITVQTARKPIVSYQMVITDSKGRNIPFNKEKYASGGTLYFYPKDTLEVNETYTVQLQYQLKDMAAQTKRWSFTTGSDFILKAIKPKFSNLDLNVAESTNFTILGTYPGRIVKDVSDQVTYSTSTPAILNVEGNQIKGLKSGWGKLIIEQGSLKKSVDVHVWPALKKKKSNATEQYDKLTDIQGNTSSDSIRWAIENGVVAGREDHTFKPNELVTEAQLWTMFLKSYQVDTTASTYLFKDGKQQIRGLYALAAERNFPLPGISQPTLRNEPVNYKTLYEWVSAAAGKNYEASNALSFAIASGYTEPKVHDLGEKITRLEAVNILYRLHTVLPTFTGRPKALSPESEIPEDWPVPEEELKPQDVTDNYIIADFTTDHKLKVRIRFSALAGQSMEFRVQTGGDEPEPLGDYPITLDRSGFIEYSLPDTFAPTNLNLYLDMPDVAYFIKADLGKVSVNEYNDEDME